MVLGLEPRRMARRRYRCAAAHADEGQEALIYHLALESIARQYNITVEQLQEWNQLSGPRIQVGHQLLVKPRT